MVFVAKQSRQSDSACLRDFLGYSVGFFVLLERMLPSNSGSIRLFRLAGVDVFLHWSWFLAAIWFLGGGDLSGERFIWSVAAYITLFVIVLIHEYGHALAARQVGGESKEIILWPFGGIAFAKVPPRPGAELWAVAAGPLVNVVLYPILYVILALAESNELYRSSPALFGYIATIFTLNKWLLIFNLLPIYPLDGGQILRALLWFKLGRAQSLRIATIIGFVGVAGLVVRAVINQSLFSAMIALFLAMECWRSYKHAQVLKQLAAMPRHPSVACPSCHESPPGGPLYVCGSCGNRFDPFSTQAICPHCNTMQPVIPCVHCGVVSPSERWGLKPRGAAGEGPVIEI